MINPSIKATHTTIGGVRGFLAINYQKID